MQEKLEADFSGKEFEEHEATRKFFKIPEERQVVDDMNEQSVQSLIGRMKDREVKFYAFLNKEFNVLNYKSARCSKHCFDDPSTTSISDANACLKVCRQGITSC